MKSIFSFKSIILYMSIICLSAYAMQREEIDNNDLAGKTDKISRTIETFYLSCQEHSKQLQKCIKKINSIKYGCGFMLLIVPYTTAYVVDNYFPQYEVAKKFVFSSISPTLLIYFISKSFYMFGEAENNIEDIDRKISRAQGLFNDIFDTYNEFKICTAKKDINRVVEMYLKDMVRTKTNLGSTLKNIIYKMENTCLLEKPQPKYALVFNSLLEAIISMQSQKIIQNRSLLDLNGLALVSCQYLDVDKLEELAANYLSRANSNDEGDKFAWVENN